MDSLKSMSRDERIAYLKKNKDLMVAAKKSQFKNADPVSVTMTDGVQKALDQEGDLEDKDELEGKVVINTTNWLDSHGDVHLPKLWNKSLNEAKNIMHLKEHKMEFDNVIAYSDDVNPYVKMLDWETLGYDYEGKTQALIFDSLIKRSVNEDMFKLYAQNKVPNHSVRMQYVRMALAIDDKDAGAEYEVWEKYLSEIVNYKVAEENGFFWVVKEAKVIEGSAVLVGSNVATPVLEMKAESFWNTLAKSVKPQDALDDVNKFYNNLNY